MPSQGFVRLAVMSPKIRVADVAYNVEQIVEQTALCAAAGAEIVLFPELALTGYTCGDLFHQRTLIDAAMRGIEEIAGRTSMAFGGLLVVGSPVQVQGQLFNAAAVLHGGRVLGVVPKSFLPTYKEFYEARYFSPAANATATEAELLSGQRTAFGTDLVFEDAASGAVVGVEICEDLWTPSPPSSLQALAGANVLLNLSASNAVVGKPQYRRQLVASQSGRCIAAYAYSSSGVHESTTDLVFDGHCLVGENGSVVAESPRFQRDAVRLVVDVDLERLAGDRVRTGTFAGPLNRHAAEQVRAFRRVSFRLPETPLPLPLRRTIDPHPFVPSDPATLRERCDEIFQSQVAGLARRLEQVGSPSAVIGVSGGLDSTLALLVACKTTDALGLPRDRVRGFTMPGFGTTSRTKGNAHALMQHLGISAREIDIRPLCIAEWRALGHAPFGIPLDGLTVETLTARIREVPHDKLSDLVFENVQARMRTQLLMNAGFVIGTGDVSELALGWCTYNADHMSMYNPNVSIPKTLVKFLVAWAAEHEFEGPARDTLQDIVGTTISPELLPASATGDILQSTEAVVGPYELHDFFLFHFLRYGATPARILFLATQATFTNEYSPEQIRGWLRLFVKRFFANQFKRSCLPDGPKVGSVSLSPRGDWRMPSDAAAAAWLAAVDEA